MSYEQAHEANERVRQERIEYARAYSEEAAEFVRRTIAGNPVPGADPYPYQGANSWRDAGRLSPPDPDPEDSWGDCWTIVAWTGRDWSAVSLPDHLVRDLGLLSR